MASNVKVVGTDLRQVTIKVNPGTYLTEVLEQACAKLKVSSDKYLLKHRQRQLDLSQPFRTSGLIAGAKLELVFRSNTPTAINVALQFRPELPEFKLFPNGRMTEKLPSDLTLWQVLRQFESGKATAGKNLNITARAMAQTANGTATGSGQLYYEAPSVQVENRTFSTLIDFQKTLSQLGYNSGSVMMRLSFVRTDKTLADAMKDIAQYFKTEGEETAHQGTAAPETDTSPDQGAKNMPLVVESATIVPAEQPAVGGTTSPDGTEDASQTLGAPPQASTDAMNIDESVSSGLRSVTIYSAPTASRPIAASRNDGEEAFMPDIALMKGHQKLLQKASENKRLLSDQELDNKAAQEAARMASVSSIQIKVRFPDTTSAEWAFGQEDTGSSLYTEVRNIMADPSAPFRLMLPDRNTIRDDSSASNKLIKSYKLRTNTLVTTTWDDAAPADTRKQPFLKRSVAGQAKKIEVFEPKEVEVKDDAGSAIQQPQQPPKRDGGSSGLKKPKWLKLGKK